MTGTAGSGSAGGLGSSGGLAGLNTHQPHRIELARAEPARHDGGQLRHANESTLPILAGQDASAVLVRLQPGGIREPHWHPSAWEMHYAIAGTAHFSVLETEGYHEEFDASAGDLIFLPQGGYHYFENTGESDYEALLVFNTSAYEPHDDIGIAAAINAVPREVLAAVLGVPADRLSPGAAGIGPVTIVRRG